MGACVIRVACRQYDAWVPVLEASESTHADFILHLFISAQQSPLTRWALAVLVPADSENTHSAYLLWWFPRRGWVFASSWLAAWCLSCNGPELLGHLHSSQWRSDMFRWPSAGKLMLTINRSKNVCCVSTNLSSSNPSGTRQVARNTWNLYFEPA